MLKFNTFTLIVLLALLVFQVHSSRSNTRFIVSSDVGKESKDNATPIIGILTQEASRFILRNYPGKDYTSYIAASYVKFVEGAGARAAPIWIGQSREYYKNILSNINGILLPGGATFFNNSNGYAEAGEHIYDVAKELNDNGHYLPIWGTCLGFELLTYLSANKTEVRSDCYSQSQSLPLEFTSDFKASRLFKSAPDDVVQILRTEAVTPNFHMYCVTEETLRKFKLNNQWKVLSLNHDWDGIEFISTIEHKKYPFYGVQFHPEKNIYEFVRNKNISHTSTAIKTSQYFAYFFINETRKSTHLFGNKTQEENSLIYNYQPEFTGRKGSAFYQMYLFSSTDVYGTGKGSSKSMLSLGIVSMLCSFWICFRS